MGVASYRAGQQWAWLATELGNSGHGTCQYAGDKIKDELMNGLMSFQNTPHEMMSLDGASLIAVRVVAKEMSDYVQTSDTKLPTLGLLHNVLSQGHK